jgi:arylsulfatase A-like enzyme
MKTNDRLNFILIHCHDLGDYPGCYGNPIPTPNIDSIAGQGVLFENHFSTGTVCSPSRGSIMTGCYPHTNGLMGLVHRGWALDTEKFPPMPELLKKAGYYTALFGTQHEHYDPACLGYEYVAPIEKSYCDLVAPVFVYWLNKESSTHAPFFASVGFYDPHRLGLNPSHFKRDVYESANPSEVEVRPCFPDIPEIRADLADFYGAVKCVDKMVGQILEAIQKNGLSENTLLAFTTDHGASFIHSKGTLYDGGTKVANIMQLPGILPAGHRVDSLTSHVDMLPSIFELLDIPVPEYVQGKSYIGAAMKQTRDPRQYVVAEKNYTNFYDPSRMIRTDSFKYIRKGLGTCIFDFQLPEVEQNASGWRTNRTVFDFYSPVRCNEELYDLKADPGELNNLINDEKYNPVLGKMRKALDIHLEKTDDPFRFVRNDLLMPTHIYDKIMP